MTTSARMRFVSVRMSEDEYESLKVLGKECGSRNLSSFIRSSLSWILANGHRSLLDLLTSGEAGRVWNTPADGYGIAALGRRISEFDRELDALKSIRDRLSRESPFGSKRGETKGNDCDCTED